MGNEFLKELFKLKKGGFTVRVKSNRMWILIAIAVILFVVAPISVHTANSKAAARVISSTILEKMINVSELSSYQAVYNGIAEVHNEKKPEKIDYYVSYEARIKAGIDFAKVKIDVDHRQNRITLTLPEVGITSVDVDIESMDYIFRKAKADTATVSTEAYKKCVEDATAECNDNRAIIDVAGENVRNVLEALIQPFVGQFGTEYQLEIV